MKLMPIGPAPHSSAVELPGSITDHFGSRFEYKTCYPAKSEPDVPAHLPDDVRRVYLKAKGYELKGDLETAGIYFRKSLDVATKILVPDDTGKNLFKRIERAVAEGKLAAELKDWAHSIRSLGADATHDADPIPDDEVKDMASLAHALFLYAFTLPALVAKHAG